MLIGPSPSRPRRPPAARPLPPVSEAQRRYACRAQQQFDHHRRATWYGRFRTSIADRSTPARRRSIPSAPRGRSSPALQHVALNQLEPLRLPEPRPARAGQPLVESHRHTWPATASNSSVNDPVPAPPPTPRPRASPLAAATSFRSSSRRSENADRTLQRLHPRAVSRATLSRLVCAMNTLGSLQMERMRDGEKAASLLLSRSPSAPSNPYPAGLQYPADAHGDRHASDEISRRRGQDR
jgi:hypothetical protein